MHHHTVRRTWLSILTVIINCLYFLLKNMGECTSRWRVSFVHYRLNVVIWVLVTTDSKLSNTLTGNQQENQQCYGIPNRGKETPRKYVFRVTSIGERSSPWPRNSMKVEINFQLDCKLYLPSAQLMLRQKLMHLTKVFASIEAKHWVSWLRPLTFHEREYELWKLPLDSSFCAVTADSKSRWSHGQKKRAYFRGAEVLIQLSTMTRCCKKNWTYGTFAFIRSFWKVVSKKRGQLTRRKNLRIWKKDYRKWCENGEGCRINGITTSWTMKKGYSLSKEWGRPASLGVSMEKGLVPIPLWREINL